jgi:hypothetical protein
MPSIPATRHHRRIGVLAASLLALALPAGAAASWTPPRTLPDSTGVAELPRAAMGLNGTVAVAFVRQGVRVAVRRDGGQIAPTALVSSERRPVDAPAIAISGRGDIVVAWVQARQSALPLQAPYRIRAVSYVPGRGWGRPRTVGTSPYFESAAPQVTANARGDAAIAWRCAGTGLLGAQTDTVCVTIRRAGHQFGDVRELPQPAGTLEVRQQQVAVGPKGGVHVAWTSLPGPVVRYAYRDVSGRWDRPRTLSGTPASRPRMAAASDGALVVAWHEAPVSRDGSEAVYGPVSAVVRSRTGHFAAARTLSAVPVFEPEVAAAPSGEVMLAWSTPRGVEPSLPDWTDVHWASRLPGSATIGEEVTANGFTDGTPSFAPTGRLGFVSSGEALLAVGGPGGVRVLTRSPGGEFAGSELVDAAGDVPQLVTRRGHAAVVFATESRQGEARLQISVRR